MKIVRDKRDWRRITCYGVAAIAVVVLFGYTTTPTFKAFWVPFVALFITQFMRAVFPARRGVDD